MIKEINNVGQCFLNFLYNKILARHKVKIQKFLALSQTHSDLSQIYSSLHSRVLGRHHLLNACDGYYHEESNLSAHHLDLIFF